MQDLYARKNELEALLLQEASTYRQSGIQYACNESEYRKAIRVETLKERAKGTPVTVTSDLVRGLDYVAELKQASLGAEAVYKSSWELIQIYKLLYKGVDAEIQRIWNSGGYQQ